MAESTVYNLTRLGRKVAGKITPGARDPLLDYLYSNRNCTEVELVGATGLSRGELLALVGKYRDYIERSGG